MKTQAFEQPQSLTLSLRISQGLHNRLESIRKLASQRKGGNVSTSEIAKQLLESARADWLEVAELLRKPTENLLAIRRKAESGQPLTRVEWTAVAHYVREGVISHWKKALLSPESYIGILQAFQSVYELRVGTSDRDQIYLGNFPWECLPEGCKPSDPVTPDVVRRTVEETLRRASNSGSLYMAEHAARNLCVFLDEEKIAGITRLNEVLSPYWPVLWRVAARGHYLTRHEPVRETAKEQAHVYRPPIPSVREGGYTLSFERAAGNEFHLLLCFPGRRGPMYPMSQYPKLAEFRAMLAALAPDLEAPQHWDGEHFFGYVVKTDEETDFCFRAHNNGISFMFSRADWASVRELFRRGWEIPEIRLAWDALSLEYGELY